MSPRQAKQKKMANKKLPYYSGNFTGFLVKTEMMQRLTEEGRQLF